MARRIGIFYNKLTSEPCRIVITDESLEMHKPEKSEDMVEIDEAEYQSDENGKPIKVKEILIKRGIGKKTEEIIPESEG